MTIRKENAMLFRWRGMEQKTEGKVTEEAILFQNTSQHSVICFSRLNSVKQFHFKNTNSPKRVIFPNP